MYYVPSEAAIAVPSVFIEMLLFQYFFSALIRPYEMMLSRNSIRYSVNSISLLHAAGVHRSTDDDYHMTSHADPWQVPKVV